MRRCLTTLCLMVMGAVSVSAQLPTSPSTPAVADPCAETKARITSLENRLNDWPALARYRDANTRVVALDKGQQRVVFIGDSITDGWDDPKYGGFFPGRPYINRGIGGQTTPQILLRFRADVIALNPRVVVILAGTNDIAGNTGPMSNHEIADNLISMAELARAHKMRVVLASVMPIHDYGKTKEGQPIIRSMRRQPERIKALNDWMRKYASENKAIYLDYYSAMIDDKGFLKSELSEDGLHPNQKGYEIMALLAEQAITSSLRN